VIDDSVGAAWLTDGTTVGFVTEEVKPRLLFGLGTVRPVAGRGGRIFSNSLFAAVSWNRAKDAGVSAIAVERDRNLSGPIQLVWLDLVKEDKRLLVTLDAYFGGLSLSPSGQMVAYFTDPGTIEFRSVANPERYARLLLVQGDFLWAPDERRILWKRANPASKKTGSLAWVYVPPLDAPKASTPAKPLEATPAPILNGLNYRDFDIAPNGRAVAVTEPGTRNLQIFKVE
jgi:hypothetical protein